MKSRKKSEDTLIYFLENLGKLTQQNPQTIKVVFRARMKLIKHFSQIISISFSKLKPFCQTIDFFSNHHLQKNIFNFILQIFIVILSLQITNFQLQFKLKFWFGIEIENSNIFGFWSLEIASRYVFDLHAKILLNIYKLKGLQMYFRVNG